MKSLKMAEDEGGYLSLSGEMLDIARSIVEEDPESPESPIRIAKIVSALTEVLIQRGNLSCVSLFRRPAFLFYIIEFNCFSLFAEKKGAMLTKCTEAKTESIKRAHVKETSPETPRKRHQKARYHTFKI
jgi:hypothetical protein